MFKKIKRVFMMKKKKQYNPNLSREESEEVESNRNQRESYKTLDPCSYEEKRSNNHVETNTDFKENYDCCKLANITSKEDGGRLTTEFSMDDFHFISPIPEDRYNEVIEHLRNNFFAGEPLNKCVGLCKPGEPHAELEAHSLNTLRDQLSVMAVDKDTDKVVAVSLNGVQYPGDIQNEKEKLVNITDDKFKQIFTLLYDLNEMLDLFSKYDANKLFDARILSVDSKYRGRGLGKEIIKRAESTAKENDFKVMKADATGLFSQKIFISLGWELIHELKYAEHLDEHGEQIFKPQPHESLKIMAKVFK